MKLYSLYTNFAKKKTPTYLLEDSTKNYTTTALTKSSIESNIEYLSQPWPIAEKPTLPISVFSPEYKKIATFDGYDDLLENYPELLL